MDQQTLQRLLHEIETLDVQKGLDMAGLLNINEELSQLLTWLVRKNRFQQSEFESRLDCTHAQANQLMKALMKKGIVEFADDDELNFHTNIRLGRNYRVPKDVWKVLDDL
jgi:predicted XRE-type DNA-binding protein